MFKAGRALEMKNVDDCLVVGKVSADVLATEVQLQTQRKMGV